MLNLNSVAAHQQIPLIHVVHEDDELLANSPEAEWYKILQNLPWEQYRLIAADYYNALYHFNKSKSHSQKSGDTSEEQKETATQRLLFERATMDETAPVLSEEEFKTDILPIVSPSMIAPGKTPDRLGGNQFFGDGPSQPANIKTKLLYGMAKISSILRFLASKIAI